MVSSTASFQAREGANPPQLVVTTAEAVPPQVVASSFGYLTSPHNLNFSFSESVQASLGESDLTLVNQTTGQTVPTGSIAVSYDGGTNIGTFTFPGYSGGILPDGVYLATLGGSGVSDAAGNSLVADQTTSFVFLTGDANHDSTVDTTDFNVLASNFGQSVSDYSQGDFNYSGNVDTIDFNLLASKFGTSLPGASVAQAAKAPIGAAIAIAAHPIPAAQGSNSLVDDLLV